MQVAGSLLHWQWTRVKLWDLACIEEVVRQAGGMGGWALGGQAPSLYKYRGFWSAVANVIQFSFTKSISLIPYMCMASSSCILSIAMATTPPPPPPRNSCYSPVRGSVCQVRHSHEGSCMVCIPDIYVLTADWVCSGDEALCVCPESFSEGVGEVETSQHLCGGKPCVQVAGSLLLHVMDSSRICWGVGEVDRGEGGGGSWQGGGGALFIPDTLHF